MTKRLGFFSLFGVTALLLAAVGAITALAAPSGVVGSVAWDSSWSNLSQSIKVTVTDSDLDTPVMQVAEDKDYQDDPSAAGTSITYKYLSNTVGGKFDYKLKEGPIQDWVTLTTTNLGTHIGDKNGTATAAEADAFETAVGLSATNADTNTGLDNLNKVGTISRDNGVVTVDDVHVKAAAGSLGVYAVDAANGVVTFIVNSATGVTSGTTTFTVTYFGSIAETTTVKVTSLSDPTGFTLTIPETGRSTGVFSRSIQMSSSATTITSGALTDTTAAASAVKIKANDGDVITAKYTDVSESSAARTATNRVELTLPTVGNVAPAQSTHTKTKENTLSADSTDALSGVKSTTIKFYMCVPTSDCTVAGNFLEVKNSDTASDDQANKFNTNKHAQSDIAGGKRTTVKTELLAGDGIYQWYAQASDNAGNAGLSKGDSKLTTFGTDNPVQLVLDTTGLGLGTDSNSSGSNAVTGQWWDPTKTGTARLITDASKAKTTSIRVVFDGNISGTSIEAADFKVDGAAPQAAAWYDGLKTSVFLTVAALNPAQTPKVEVVAGAVADQAGNINATLLPSTGTLNAVDGIGPTLTVTLTGDAGVSGVPISATSISAAITTNETLLGVPAVKTVKVKVTSSSDSTLIADGSLADAGAVTFVSTDNWTKSLTAASLLPSGGAKMFVAEVSGADSGSNSGKLGGSDPTATAALIFELDKTLPTPSITPAAAASVTRTDPFITIDWTGEGTEYDGDSHKKVTLTTLTLDGVDQLANAATTDNRTFILATSGLALGDHKLVVNGKDESGNKLSTDVSITFKVKEAAKTSISVKPGYNLISLPNQPVDTAINSVITLTQVSSVITYDPINKDPDTGSPWLTAARVGTGALTGSLKTIDAQHAYWVNTSSFDPIKVSIPAQGFTALPPAIQVVEGWNMVPVVTISGQAPGSTISADTYFGSTKWVTAYTYDTQASSWTKVLPSTFANVTVGSGYWVYITEAGILVP